MDISPILQNCMSADRTVGMQAEAQLKDLEQQNAGMLMVLLATELANEQKQDPTRQAAGLYLKNMLTAKNEHRKTELANRWVATDPNMKGQIKQMGVQALGSVNLNVGRAAAQLISRVALIELPRREWPDLIQLLVHNVGVQNKNLKISSLETLGYICEDIEPEVLGQQSNQILTAVIQGMNKSETDLSVRIAATHSLNNALIFIRSNFDVVEERNFIMSTIYETCSATGEDPNLLNRLKLTAFECLVKVADLYYDYLPEYMQGFAQITFEAIKFADESIGRMAIEFWCTICDEEIELIAGEEEAAQMGVAPERRCNNFIRAALQSLVVLLLEKLTLLEEDDDDDNISASAGTCLTLLVNTVKDEAVGQILPFIETHIASGEWKLKASAILAFGFLLEGPSESKLASLISTALPALLDGLNHPVDRVKDSAAWTLSRTCEFHSQTVEPFIQPLVRALVPTLQAEPRVANNACWALHFLELRYADVGAAVDTNQMSPYFSHIIQALLACTQRDDADEANLRISAYEVINTVISAGAKDTLEMIAHLIQGLLQRLHATFQMSVMSAEDKEEQAELQGLLCGVFTAIINKLGEHIQPYADSMMEMFLQVLNQDAASVHEEALLSISAIATAVGPHFAKYSDPLQAHLLRGLRNHAEYEVCSVAVGVVGDMARALGKNFSGYADTIITILLENLQNVELDNSVKPPILGVFGDIAMAIGEHFVRYLSTVMQVLGLASQISVDRDDEDMMDYLNEIRESVFEAYIGIVQGLSDDEQQGHLAPYVEHMFNFVRMAFSDNMSSMAVLKTSVALVGDVATYCGPQCERFIDHQIISLIKASIPNPEIEDAEYAMEAVKKIKGNVF